MALPVGDRLGRTQEKFVVSYCIMFHYIQEFTLKMSRRNLYKVQIVVFCNMTPFGQASGADVSEEHTASMLYTKYGTTTPFRGIPKPDSNLS
jgi:hypothetical protein